MKKVSKKIPTVSDLTSEEDLIRKRDTLYQEIATWLPFEQACRKCYNRFVVDDPYDVKQSHWGCDSVGGVWVYCPHCGQINMPDWRSLDIEDARVPYLIRYSSIEKATIVEWWKRVTRKYKYA